MISSRGGFALRVVIDLARQNSDGYVPLKEIAERKNISKNILTMQGVCKCKSPQRNIPSAKFRMLGKTRWRLCPAMKTAQRFVRVPPTVTPFLCGRS